MVSRIVVLLCLLPLVLLLSCDSLGGSNDDNDFDDFPEGPDSFSLEVRVEDEEGEPIEDAEVGVRPCYETGCTESIVSEQKSLVSKDATITSFSASVDNGSEVVLSWTADEASTAGYYIDRKSDGSFEQIGFVEGSGSGNNQNYRFRDRGPEPGNEYSYRLVEEDLSEGEIPKDTITVTLVDPESTEIDPIYPNPISSSPGILELRIADPSDVKSTAYLLNGEEASMIVDGQLDDVGRYTYEWPRLNDQVGDGLYLIHSRAQTDGNTVATSTDYVIHAQDTSNAATIGSTSEDGIVSTESPARFPALYELPAIELRDENGNSEGTITNVPKTVQFVVTILRDEYVFERRVTEGENTLTLTVSR